MFASQILYNNSSCVCDAILQHMLHAIAAELEMVPIDFNLMVCMVPEYSIMFYLGQFNIMYI